MTKAVAEQPALPVNGTKEMALEPVQPAALPAPPTGDPFLALIRELSVDDRVDPVKLAAIFDLKRGLEADRAKLEYVMAFSAMSDELPVITKKGQIKNKAGQVQSKYARYEDIQRIVKPILRRHGFTVNHEQTPDNSAEMVLTSFLMHRGGHSQKSTFRAKADDSGSKNDVQGLGSIASYAKRYNVVALLDLEMQGEDDDGQMATAMTQPAGFADWIEKMRDESLNGTKALTAAWQASDNVFKNFILVRDWESMKAAAKEADKRA
jgi:hypothetical protein